MRRSIISLSAGSILAGLALLAPSTAAAQKKENTETVKFETVDAVDLKGTFWPSSKGKKGPVAILLHRIGGKSKEAGWPELAEDLQKAGFAVLAFDFRGHGESTGVGAAFWTHPMNQYVRRTGPQATTVALDQFPVGYLPNLINDIAAAKRFIERRYNDAGECNCSNIVLIGAEDGATLGALWLSSETKRYRIIPVGMFGQRNERPESKDVIACVWLSMAETLGPGTGAKQYVGSQLPRWLKDAGNTKESKVTMLAESKIPMGFIYGKKESSPGTSARLVKAIRMGAAKDDLKGTVERSINTNLAGHKMLVEADTRERIVKTYLTDFILDEKKGLNEWEKRESSDSGYNWYFPTLRQPSRASMKGEKNLAAVPLNALGLR